MEPLSFEDTPPTSHKFFPASLVPISGIYTAVHLTGHRPDHDVLAIRGEQFPLCRICKTKVQFRFVRAISHMLHDWDFAGPAAA